MTDTPTAQLTTAAPLSDSEQADLTRYCRIVDRGLRTVATVGDALMQIRDRRLYRVSHGSFQAFVASRWSISVRHANRLASAAGAARAIRDELESGTRGPTREKHLRELSRYDPSDAARIWEAALEKADGGEPTSDQVSEAAEEYHGGETIASLQRRAARDLDVARAAEEAETREDARGCDEEAGGDHAPTESQEMQPRATVARQALHSSASSEWYTPSTYVESARRVMGCISLDPASCKEANSFVQAEAYHGLDVGVNGLRVGWYGNIWLNPPYGRDASGKSNLGHWVRHLLEQHEAGNVAQAVALLNATTDRSWFQALWDYPLCFARERIRFWMPGGAEGPSPTHGSVFVYLGQSAQAFCDEFRQYGRIVVPYGVEGVSTSW